MLFSIHLPAARCRLSQTGKALPMGSGRGLSRILDGARWIEGGSSKSTLSAIAFPSEPFRRMISPSPPVCAVDSKDSVLLFETKEERAEKRALENNGSPAFSVKPARLYL